MDVLHEQSCPHFTECKQNFFNGILKSGPVEPFNSSDLLPNSNIIGYKYILTIMDPGNILEHHKSG